jgi:crossover junction endodeoxyribonuclease RuvC
VTRVATPPKRQRLRILGIDPGTLRMGYGVVDAFGPSRVSYVECGVITASRRLSRQARLVTIGRDLEALMDDVGPAVLALEEAFMHENVQATLALGEVRGLAIYAAARRGLDVVGYAPARVKRTVVGHGRAPKPQVAYLVRALLGLRRTPEADAADALAIALCHARLAAAVRPGAGRAAAAGGPAR